MKSKFLIIVAIFLTTPIAFAQIVVCEGTGRFGGISSQVLIPDWGEHFNQILLEKQDTKIQVNINEPSPDGTQYISLELLEQDRTGETIVRGAKGSINYPIMYWDGPSSVIHCHPVSKLPPPSTSPTLVNLKQN